MTRDARTTRRRDHVMNLGEGTRDAYDVYHDILRDKELRRLRNERPHNLGQIVSAIEPLCARYVSHPDLNRGGSKRLRAQIDGVLETFDVTRASLLRYLEHYVDGRWLHYHLEHVTYALGDNEPLGMPGATLRRAYL
jgi:hypothetical protein